VQAEKLDDWRYDKLEIQSANVVGHDLDQVQVNLRTPLPTHPVPRTFILRFQTDPLPPETKPHALRVTTRLEASRFMGLTGGSSSKSELIPLTDSDGD
jgi:hypothetical protein